MSFVVAVPEALAAAASDVANIGSALSAANAAAAAGTTGLLAAGADEVSAALASLFSGHAVSYQQVAAQATALHDQFVQALTGAGGSYALTEAANVQQNLLNAINAPTQALLGRPLIGDGAVGTASSPDGQDGGLLFGRYGQEFQTVSNQLAAFHTEFVRTLNRGAAAYLNTESANGGQLFGQIEAGQRAVSAAAAAAPGGAYGQLVANTATNLESLYGAWSANPFPFLRQIIANQQVYWQQIAAALANAVQNFPALVANLPAAIDAAVQQFLAFNAAYYIQQIISSQIGFAQLFATTVGQGVTSVIAGWPNLAAELQLAFQQLLVGDYNAAVANLGKAMTNLLVTGFDTSDVTIGTMGTTISVTAKPKLLGPLGDLFTIMTIPAQEAQYFTNLMPPSILRDMSQNFTNVLTTLSNPNIQAVASFDIATTAGTLSTFFGVPLVLTYATLGAPFASLNAIATSAETIEQALLAGNYLGAVGALIDAPAHALDGFLNSATVLDTPILVPTGLPSPLPPTVGITLHLPFDGILVPPHPVTATISFPGAPVPIPGFPTTVTVFGTPFMGMAPLLINYIPQQLALAIKPAA